MPQKTIELLTSFQGAWSGNVGDEVTLPEAECERIIAKGFAKWPTKAKRKRPPRETATSSERETATTEE